MASRSDTRDLLLVEEASAALRHDVIGSLSAVGLALHRLKSALREGDVASAELLAQARARIADATTAVGASRLPTVHADARVDLSALVRRVVRRTASRAAYTRVAFHLELAAADTPVVAVAAARELEVALGHVLRNAREAGGRARTTITLRVTSGRGYGRIEVEDDAGGSSAEASERALEPFFTTKPSHLGLGLPVAARVARRWRGRLSVGRGAHGARVTFDLPLAPHLASG
jgi:signal transduction histidine kinase